MQKIIQLKNINTIKLLKSYENFISNKKNNNFELFILTTAINRPELHNISFNNYKNIIPTDIKIKWIINLDYVKFEDNKIPVEELNKTKDNILEIFNDYNNITFDFILNEKGNFNKAVRNITDATSNSISKNCQDIFYLEDDWYSINDFNLIELINSKHDIIKLYYDGDPRKKLSFQPVIIKPYIWYYMFYQKLKNDSDTNKDPEKICQLFSELNNFNWKYQLFNYFKDIGRDSSINNTNSIRGWYQKESNSISMTYIYIDQLLKSIIYIISKKNLDEKRLVKEIDNYLNDIFLKDVIRNILEKYEENKIDYFKFYQKCCKYVKNNFDIKYVYQNINKLVIE